MTTDLERLRRAVCCRAVRLPGGWCELARRTGKDRAALWRAFQQEGNTPSLSTVLAVLPSLGLRLEVTEA